MATTPKTAAASIGNNIQDTFLNTVMNNRAHVTVFLVNGVKLVGRITGFDAFTLALTRDSATQLVYKTAVSTVMPGESAYRGEGL